MRPFLVTLRLSPQLWISAAGLSQPAVDLAKNNYYLLLASGPVSGASLSRHRSRGRSYKTFSVHRLAPLVNLSIRCYVKRQLVKRQFIERQFVEYMIREVTIRLKKG